MAKRSGFEGFVRAAARAAAAAERERQRQLRAAVSQARRAERDARMLHNQSVRDQRAADKLAKQQYLDDRLAEAQDRNSEIHERLEELGSILQHTLQVEDRVEFESLRTKADVPSFQVPPELRPAARPRIREREAAHEKLVSLREAEAASRNAEVDEFEAQYRDGQGEAIVAYNEMVLTRSQYPDVGFPQNFRLAFVDASRELVIEYDLPEPAVVPCETDFRYVRSRDAIESKSRKPAEIKQLYQDIIAAVCLRTLHEVFEADQANAISSATFTGIRDTHDLATGNAVRVPVISVRTTKADFTSIHLDRVDKLICLRNLGAQVSSRPDELQAVKPIVEFNMADRRFVAQGDALSGLESRPNLLELTPTEFEVLVSNLFTKMGLDTKLTRASKDGGVDAVAFDVRPVIGGKVVIQAKRYKDTVGVSAVRDLYGTMQHEGANKGVLVCTSGYGPDAFRFSKDKPIELIDGGGLLYLLRQHAGIDARILVH